MTNPLCEYESAVEDEAFAEDMRDYCSWVARQPDDVDHLGALAEGAAIGRMEDEGIASVERKMAAGRA